MTRDQVIEYAKDWVALMDKWGSFTFDLHDDGHERKDVMRACIDLAYNRTKEALIAYTKEREAEIAAHERMLETIEATLQGGLKDGI
jgi:hypothetical protein